MRYLSDTLNTLLAAFGLTLEPWMAPVAALLIFGLLMPFIIRGRKIKLARKRLQESSHASSLEDRRRLQREAFELVGDAPMGLVAIAEESLRRGMRPAAQEAVRLLADTGKERDMLKTLRRKLDGDRPRNPEAEAAAIERLLEAGMTDEARSRFRAATRRWPDAAALAELHGRVD